MRADTAAVVCQAALPLTRPSWGGIAVQSRYRPVPFLGGMLDLAATSCSDEPAHACSGHAITPLTRGLLVRSRHVTVCRNARNTARRRACEAPSRSGRRVARQSRRVVGLVRLRHLCDLLRRLVLPGGEPDRPAAEYGPSRRRLSTLAEVPTGTISSRWSPAVTASANARPKAWYGPPCGPVANRSRRTGPDCDEQPARRAASPPAPSPSTLRRSGPGPGSAPARAPGASGAGAPGAVGHPASALVTGRSVARTAQDDHGCGPAMLLDAPAYGLCSPWELGRSSSGISRSEIELMQYRWSVGVG